MGEEVLCNDGSSIAKGLLCNVRGSMGKAVLCMDVGGGPV